MTRQAPHPDLGAAIVGLVGTRGAMSRSAIAKHLKVSAATITSSTKALVDEGTLVEIGTLPSAGGRPATLLAVTQQRRSALGVKVTPNHLTMAEVDFEGHPQPSFSIDLDMAAPEAVALIADTIAEYSEPRSSTLLGIGLAIPGFVNPSAPGLVTSPVLGWSNLDLGGFVRDRVGLPVVIDNDVNTLAIADQLYGEDPRSGSRLLVTIGYGIGAALTIEGEVHRGARGAAGELGHIVVEPAGEVCACGLRGCLETLIGDNALAERARVRGIIAAHHGKTELNLAAASNPRAREIFDEAGAELGRALANLVHLFDPESITISGEGVDMWHHWSPAFLRTMRAHVPQHRRDIPVTTRPWGDDMWAHGAASLVFATPLTIVGASSGAHEDIRRLLMK